MFIKKGELFMNTSNITNYGLRKYKNQIKENKEIAKELQNGNKPHTRTNTKDKQNNWNLQIHL